MPDIDLCFHCLRLAICECTKPIAERKRKVDEERCQVVRQEVAKLTIVGFIREIEYSTWLSNVFMIKNPNEKWRMWYDDTNLNRVCPKDAPSLSNIDQLGNGATGHWVLSFFGCLFRLQ